MGRGGGQIYFFGYSIYTQLAHNIRQSQSLLHLIAPSLVINRGYTGLNIKTIPHYFSDFKFAPRFFIVLLLLIFAMHHDIISIGWHRLVPEVAE